MAISFIVPGILKAWINVREKAGFLRQRLAGRSCQRILLFRVGPAAPGMKTGTGFFAGALP
jgi:hypothetical protein